MDMEYVTQVYAARNKDAAILNISSSGGLFLALSTYRLEHGGVVACAVYNYEKSATEFKLISNKEELISAIGSKYMQSYPCNIFKDCKNWIVKHPDKKLLFIGMGCQADGFRKYAEINQFRNKVYIVDIICHGSPSPRLWKEYANGLMKKYKNTITYLTFKNKRNGWNAPTAYVKISDKEIPIASYMKLFYSRCILRPACHTCPYTTMRRHVDMTIGDFWGIEQAMPTFYSKRGNSLVLIHSKSGEMLFNDIRERLDYAISNIKDCEQPNLIKPTQVSKKREQFWKCYRKVGVVKLMQIYKIVHIAHKIKNKLVAIMRE